MNAQERERTEEEHRDFLDEIYGEVKICGMTFDSGRALQLLDPIAFRCDISSAPIEWECEECNTNHGEDEDAANECCQKECEECGTKHNTEEAAENCCPKEEEKEKANDGETKLR